MEDPALRNKYKKYKYAVKTWESKFKKAKGRIPSKYDIREAPMEIRQAYKMYYKMKTSFLEDTLSEVLSEDGFDILNNSENDSIDVGSPMPGLRLSDEDHTPNTTLPELQLPQSFSSPPISKKQTDFEAVENNPLNEKAWQNVEKKIEVEKPKSPPKPVMKLNTKLFPAKSFSIRNPRKKFTGKNLQKSLSTPLMSTGDAKETLPDLETILMEKARAAQAKEVPFKTDIIAKPKIVSTNIDKGWLNRCVLDPELKNDSVTTSSTETKRYGLSNIDVENIKRNAAVSNPDPVEKRSLDEQKNSDRNNVENMKIVPQENFESARSFVAKGKETAQNVTTEIKTYAKSTCMSDSDSVVSNSEDESTANKTSIRHVIKKRKIMDVPEDNANLIKVPSKSEPAALSTRAELLSQYDFVDDDPVPKSSKKKRTKSKARETKGGNTKSREKPKMKERNISARNKKNISYTESHSAEDEKDSASEDYSHHKASPITKNRRGRKHKSDIVPKSTKGGKKVSKAGEPADECNTLDSEDIKDNIMLSTDRILSLPRVDADELVKAESALQDYLLGSNSSVDRKTDMPEIIDAGSGKQVKKKNLNENFVRLNLRKKIYVRGHKHLNFSRYKKKMWKQKKSEQEMDMRGCDGGMLTCFKCGNTGHFARNCKYKDDELLSIDAVDDSPFPTLEEAEKMASEKALIAHSRNISKLPENTNSLLYKDIASDTDYSEGKESDEEKTHNMEEDISEGSEEQEPLESTDNPSQPPVYIGHKIPHDFLQKSGLLELTVGNKDVVEPLYERKPDGSILEPTKEVYSTLRMFGHTQFRKGQERAIMRVLSGVSTLVTLNTGSGKSLCYQLPAYLYARKRTCITLVISPLVSLMEDQVHGVPSFINAQCLHTNQTPAQKEKVMDMIKQGKVEILLVSPEAVVAGEKSTGFGSLLRQLPPIAFACIDEVHCVSQWSHNFRPSYLMICKVLKQKLGVKTILGLTATATVPTKMSIIQHLAIDDGLDGIVSDSTLPDNLILSVSKDENRDGALISLLRSERFADCQSIIVYCTRRDDCERIAGLIRTCLQDNKPSADSKKRKRVNWNAEPYHAGLAASRRRTIQSAFMKNDLRIVVATIAFGMGINKPDIRAVIHFNMPKSFESYVQEVGRAGRDGKIAHCHLFLDSRGTDESELSRFIYANSVDRHVIRKLLKYIFVPCSCKTNMKKADFVADHAEAIKDAEGIDWNEDFADFSSQSKEPKKRICPGHEAAFSVEKTVEQLDIPEENISTLLCYLELDDHWNVKVLSNAYVMCKVISYGGPKALKEAAKDCPPLAMAIAIELKKKTVDESSSCVEFSVIEVAAAIGWDSGVVKYNLKNLEWKTVDGIPKRSSLSVTYFDLGFRVQAPGDLTDEELDNSLDVLYSRSMDQEKTQLAQLRCVSKGLSSVAFRTCSPCESKDFSRESSNKLKSIIQDYFQSNDKQIEETQIERKIDKSKDNIIMDDVRAMINMYPENNFTGRTLAKIFHGIQSPNYPAVIWGRCKYWRAHTKIDFNHIVQIANCIIVKMRT